MKKIIALLTATMLLVALLAGCGKTTPSPTPAEPTPPASEAPSGGEAKALKTGLAILTTIDGSENASADKEGTAKFDSVVVAVTVADGGVIDSCIIDMVQTAIAFNAEGKVTTPLDTTFPSKNELGDEYGMKKKSNIGKEWNEQAAAFAEYVVGKTVDEVKGIAINEEGRPTGEDLTASVTVHVDDFIAAIDKAVTNAQDLGAKAGDKLGLSSLTNIEKSTDAGEAEGLAQAYSTYLTLTTDAAGTITSSIIDSSQTNVNFDTTGAITTDLSAELKTKNELGDEYGMKKKSSIGKEWNEQAAAFAEYITGKTPAEVAGIAVSEGLATDADLLASVTIHITDFMTLVEKAVK